ncbi:hypothetical protein KVT40_003218 [Elsinoe batatas]|uniref:Uncharacterized protein n=1 Tax=Elsinoe batatas TaxID=2601811 RepID=A0A8K0PJB2_9PEZI|nr:hypothetical protein KVT40_003218 [Elsinoe batatas]
MSANTPLTEHEAAFLAVMNTNDNDPSAVAATTETYWQASAAMMEQVDLYNEYYVHLPPEAKAAWHKFSEYHDRVEQKEKDTGERVDFVECLREYKVLIDQLDHKGEGRKRMEELLKEAGM